MWTGSCRGGSDQVAARDSGPASGMQTPNLRFNPLRVVYEVLPHRRHNPGQFPRPIPQQRRQHELAVTPPRPGLRAILPERPLNALKGRHSREKRKHGPPQVFGDFSRQPIEWRALFDCPPFIKSRLEQAAEAFPPRALGLGRGLSGVLPFESCIGVNAYAQVDSEANGVSIAPLTLLEVDHVPSVAPAATKVGPAYFESVRSENRGNMFLE